MPPTQLSGVAETEAIARPLSSADRSARERGEYAV